MCDLFCFYFIKRLFPKMFTMHTDKKNEQVEAKIVSGTDEIQLEYV
jgi:hypothetical protein